MAGPSLDITVNDKTAAALGRINQRIKGLDTSMASINSRGKLLVSTLAGIAAGGIVRSIISTTARFEDLRTTLSSVTGSAEAGAEAFKFIQEFSTQTQFGVEELTQTYIKLASNGIEPSIELLTKFTDASAVTTDQIGSLTSLTDFYTRSLQAQKVELTDLNRLSDRGLPVYDIIKEKLGITRGEISKFSGVAGNTIKIVEALGDGISERFGGATQARVKNLSTRISNFQIALKGAADLLGQGFNQALGETIEDVTELITKNDELIKQLGRDLGTGVEKSAKFIKSLGDEFNVIKDAATDVIAGYKALPPFVQEVGIFGAIILGTRGRLLLLAITGIIGSIAKQIDDIAKTDFSIDPGLEGKERLEAINEQMALLEERANKIKDSNFGESLVINTPGGEITSADLGLDAIDEYNDLMMQKRNLEMDAFQTSMSLAYAYGQKTKAQNEDKDSLNDLTEITLTNTDAIKGAGVGVDNLVDVYKNMIVQSDNLITSTTRQLTPLQQAQKKYSDITKQIEQNENALIDLNGAFETDEELIRQIKEQLPELTTALGILEEQMAELAAMESPFFEFGKHIKEQGDAMKQLGALSTQVYDRMANDLTNFVMTGKFNFKDFSRFVIQELIKIAIQAALTFAIKSIAGSFGFAIPGLADGGPVRSGRPYVVGEEGPELFVPNSSGKIVPNGEMTQSTEQSGDGDVYVNFNINTVDASGFDELLVARRSTIVGIINEGLNRQGKRALI